MEYPNYYCLKTLKYGDHIMQTKVLYEEKIITGIDDGKLNIWCLKTNSCINAIN